MGDVSQALGAGSSIEFEGQVYQLAPLTYALQAKYETWLERRAVEAVRRQRSYLDDDEYQQKMTAVDRDIAAGIYSFGSKACQDASRSIHGLKELIRLSLAKNYPEVNHEFVDRLFDTKMQEAANAFMRANADPLPQAPPPDGG